MFQQSTNYGGDDSDSLATATVSSLCGSHRPTITGDIHLRMTYDYRDGRLNVCINRCRHLIDVKKNRPNPYVKVQLLSVGGNSNTIVDGDDSTIIKRKTRTKRHQNDPIFNEVLQVSSSILFDEKCVCQSRPTASIVQIGYGS